MSPLRRGAVRRAPSEGDVILAALDAAYDLVADDQDWLSALLGAVAPALDRGLGLVAFFYDISNSARVGSSNGVGLRVDPEALANVAPLMQAYAPELIERSLGGPQLVGTTFEYLGMVPPAAPGGAPSVRDLIDIGLPAAYLETMRTSQGVEALCVRAHRPEGLGLLIGATLARYGRTSKPFRARWSRVSAHIASAWRLRDQLRQTGRPLGTPAAVLTPAGKLEAVAFDPSRGQRDVLKAAVRDRERARGPLRREAPDEARDLWQGLVQGRWSLVDQIDRDGRRFVLARRNEPATPALPGLTVRERQVVSLASQGYANKLIAYSIGLSVSTVATHLARAVPKLNVPARRRLALRRASSK